MNKKNRITLPMISVLLTFALILTACGAPSTATPVIPETGPTEAPSTEARATEAPATEAATELAATEPAAEGGEMADSIRVAVVRGAMIDTMTKLADAYEQANSG